MGLTLANGADNDSLPDKPEVLKGKRHRRPLLLPANRVILQQGCKGFVLPLRDNPWRSCPPVSSWAAPVIAPGENILLDAGSDVRALAQELRGFEKVS